MLLNGKMEGIGYFTFETMKRITVSHPEAEFIFLFDRPFDAQFIFSDNIIPLAISPPARHPLLWYWWHEWSLPAVFKKYKPDYFISTDGYLSLSTDVQTLAVFHDINFEHYPKDLPFFNRLYYRHYFPKFAKKAKRIAAVSEFTKNDLIKCYGIDPGKIDVVYNGVHEEFKPVNESIRTETRKKFSNDQPYFLFVGALHQRKNISRLLQAFDKFKQSVSSPMKLVLAGQKRWWTSEMEEAFTAMMYKEDVIFTGRISHQDLLNLTASAFAITYVSIFEGFGIPIVEAMRCGIPVLTSNVTSMPEIAGHAALFCNPFDVESISEAMKKMYADEPLRKSLIEKGFERQKDFSWEKTADGIWKSFEKMM
jgi:glycosyltransferase involved in cell wall biosynthesis